MKTKNENFLVSNLMNCKENNEKVILGLCFRINSAHLVLVVFARNIFCRSFANIVYTEEKNWICQKRIQIMDVWQISKEKIKKFQLFNIKLACCFLHFNIFHLLACVYRKFFHICFRCLGVQGKCLFAICRGMELASLFGNLMGGDVSKHSFY